LADCSTDISREHFLSASIIDSLSSTDPLLVSGLPWLEGEEKELSANSLASKMLCSRHNHALSSLDGAALQFIETLSRIHQVRSAEPSSRADLIVLIINGHDLERWCMKVLVGALYSGNASLLKSSEKGRPPKEEWIEYLFGERGSPRSGGFHVISPHEAPPTATKYVAIWPLARQGRPVGLVVQAHRFSFAAVFDPIHLSALPEGKFRPTQMVVETPSGTQTILLSWEHGGCGEGIGLSWKPLP
jgi:hypothetical protein